MTRVVSQPQPVFCFARIILLPVELPQSVFDDGMQIVNY